MLVYVHEYAKFMTKGGWRPGAHFAESVPSTCVSQGWNSGHQPGLALLATEPSHQAQVMV